MRMVQITFLLLFAVLSGCSKSTEPKEVSAPPPTLSAILQQAAVVRGKTIAAEAFSLLSSNLQAAIQSGGVSNALPFCSLAASPLTAGLASKYGVNLRRITHRARNPHDKANEVEAGILRSFEAAVSVGDTNISAPIATNLLPGMATFFAPIVLNNELCLKCHGEAGREIAPENLAVIQRLYPLDEATGFKLGDLRGAWRIDIPLVSLAPSQ